MGIFSRDRAHDDGLAHVLNVIVRMLGDARHSFDLAMSAVVAGADATIVGVDVRDTDDRINAAEQEIRRRLLVHAAVQGSGDVDMVMGYLLLSRKIERIGDQAKNILDLALEGVDLSAADDTARFSAYGDRISTEFAQIGELLVELDAAEAHRLRGASNELIHELEAGLRELIHSDGPSSHGVPRALLLRYLKRTVANLAGVLSSLIDPFDQVDYPDGADTDD